MRLCVKMKSRKSKLDPYVTRLEEWFLAGKTFKDAQAALMDEGCQVSEGRLCEWWQTRQADLEKEKLLAQIVTGAKYCREVDEAMKKNHAPELRTLMGLHRVLILKLSTEGNLDTEKLELVNRMMREVQKYARLEQLGEQLEIEKRKLSMLEAKAAQADKAEEITKSEVTAEEKAARMKLVFGIA